MLKVDQSLGDIQFVLNRSQEGLYYLTDEKRLKY